MSMHCGRIFFPIRALLAIAAVALTAPLQAAPVPSLFVATVADSDAQQAAQDALRQVLVRLTGSRDAAADPALAGLLADARHYVQLERGTTAGSTQVVFDGAALRDAVAAAGGSVWDLDRPLLWVDLPAGAADDLRARLTSAAQARGVPLLIAPAGTEVPSDSTGALAAARKAGADAALLVVVGADPGAANWTLSSAAASGQWSGTPETAIDGAVDAMVRSAREIAATPLTDVDCRIAGVNDLPAFTTVLDAFSALPGVTTVAIDEVAADNLTLHLKAHGNGPALQRAAATGRLQAVGADTDGTLEYRLQSGT